MQKLGVKCIKYAHHIGTVEFVTYSQEYTDEVVLLVDRMLTEKYSPHIYRDMSQDWPEGFVLGFERGDLIGLIFAVPVQERNARVIIFCVDDRYQGKGYGTQLLDEVQRRAMIDGFKLIRLEVRCMNEDVVNFYKNRGFHITGSIQGFYNDGTDAYNMIHLLE